MTEEPDAVEIGKRLKLIRKALNLTQASLCRLADIPSAQAWNNAETGDNLISIANAVRLCGLTGVTLDYIYTGRIASALPVTLLEQIQQAQLGKKKR